MATGSVFRKCVGILCLLSLCVFCFSESQTIPITATLETPSGPVEIIGTSYPNDGWNSFLSIPYTQPPQPFRKSVAVKLDKQFYANRTGLACHVPTKFQLPHLTYVRDCLILNIWTPSNIDPTNEKLPVWVYIHGGGFNIGSASDTIWHAGELTKYTKTIIVTLNYRLGLLGFGYHDSIGDAHGTLGLLDQTLALHFIHSHIQNFGGDPDRITLSGYSAGSWSTCFHLFSEYSANTFSQAMLLSGSCIDFVGSASLPSSTLSKKFMDDALDAAEVDENRLDELTDEQLQKIQDSYPFPFMLPTVDGDFIADKLDERVRDGTAKINTKKIVGGTTNLDTCLGGTSKLGDLPGDYNMSVLQFMREFIQPETYDKIVEDVIRLYNVDESDEATPEKIQSTWEQINMDIFFDCGTRNLAFALCEQEGMKLHVYKLHGFDEPFVTRHAADTMLIFQKNATEVLGGMKWSVESSRRWMDIFAPFVRGEEFSFGWKPFCKGNEVLKIRGNLSMGDELVSEEKCKLWSKLSKNEIELMGWSFVQKKRCGNDECVSVE